MKTNPLFKSSVIISELTKNKFSDFEKNYIQIREKEERVLSIAKIKQLPNVDKHYKHYSEWEIRKKNITRFLKYLSHKKRPKRILDIGCGNGFFTNMMALQGHSLAGVDVNLTELYQASEAFPNKNIKWYYIDVLNEELPEEKFDFITFCASFQYFEDPKAILNRCFELLTKQGEIHIIDSPFYTPNTIEVARQNSSNYFHSLNSEGMNKFYKHNTYKVLEEFKPEFLYKKKSFLKRVLRLKDSPFPWIKITG